MNFHTILYIFSKKTVLFFFTKNKYMFSLAFCSTAVNSEYKQQKQHNLYKKK